MSPRDIIERGGERGRAGGIERGGERERAGGREREREEEGETDGSIHSVRE